MLHLKLLSDTEEELYEYIRLSFFQGIKPVLFIQLTALAFCSALFFDAFKWSGLLWYWLWLLFYSSVLVAHLAYAKKHKLWLELKHVWQLSIFILLYICLGYASWGWLILYLLDSHAANVAIVIVISTACGVVAIISFSGLQRVFMFAMLLVLASLIVILYYRFGYDAYPYMLTIVGVGVFQYVLLKIQNKKLLETLSLKLQNIEMVGELQYKNDQLVQINLSQSRYLSAASHDLRQPLHALALIADDVRRKNNNTTIDLSLKQMQWAIDSLSKSFDVMLNLSRLDAGVIKPHIQAVAIQWLLDRLAVEFEAEALDKGLRFVVVPSQVWVEADDGILYSILSNFVSNAIKYTEKGGVLIGIRTRGSLVMPVVYDTGVGIPSDKLGEIFGEHQRLDYARQRVIGGVGLGLAISERMATLLKAFFVVRSELGRGSSFGICLPIAHGHHSAATVDLNVYVIDVLLNKKVVILDDDKLAAERLDDLFRSWGMNVSIVLSIEMLQELVDDEGDVDLVVSDYHLGLERENGVDVLQVARKIQPNHPPHCVLITGDTTIDLIDLARELQIHLLHKPIGPARLRAFLNGLLNNDVS